MSTNKITGAACTFKGEITPSEPKTMKVKLQARSGDPIDHYAWGRVVHDFAGMQVMKERLPLDYCHDDKELIGYLNNFDASSGDLMASGVITPTSDNDRASEVIAKMKAGVPYEASINFGGTGIVVENVEEGEEVEVNGKKFSGPLTVVRQWPLRGVAVCPYGADQNTSTNMFKNMEEITFTNLKKECVMAKLPEEEDEEMKGSETSGPEKSPETRKQLPGQNSESEMEGSETSGPEKSPEVVVTPANQPIVEAHASEEEEGDGEEEDEENKKNEKKFAQDELKKMIAEFGAADAATLFAEGLSLEEAKMKHYETLKAQNEKLSAEIAALKNPVKGKKQFSDVPDFKVNIVDTTGVKREGSSTGRKEDKLSQFAKSITIRR